MTEKEVNKLFNHAIVKLRASVKDNQFAKLRWIFLEGIRVGLTEAQKVLKS